jgi:hypothetical protein
MNGDLDRESHGVEVRNGKQEVIKVRPPFHSIAAVPDAKAAKAAKK